MTLSRIETTRIPFRRHKRAIVPKHGAIRGIQNLMTTRSIFALRIFRTVENHEKGLMLFIVRVMDRSSGLGESEYCVFPGKRKSGYCIVKVNISTSCPSSINCLAKRSLKAANPPLYGHDVPTIPIRTITHVYN